MAKINQIFINDFVYIDDNVGMLSVFLRLFMGVFIFTMVSCGQSVDGLRFYQAASKQYSLDNSVLQLFERGPTWDSKTPSFSALDNLNSIRRTFVFLDGLNSYDGPLVGYKDNTLGFGLSVQFSAANASSPVFSVWAGYDMNANSKEFKAFMAYAHLSQAYRAALGMASFEQLLTSDNYNLEAHTNIEGSFLETSFSYNEPVANVFTEPTITFYQHRGDDLDNLNMVHEADAVYHEFAHYIQFTYNPELIATAVSNVESGVVINHDSDAIIEGTADFFTAAMVKNTKILQYLSNNLNILNGSTSYYRFGNYSRNISSFLNFDDSYTFDFYMDGRVVASSLYDLSKQYSSCSGLQNEDPWMLAFEAAMLALKIADNNLTYQSYFESVIDEANAQFVAGSCAARTDTLQDIFQARGVMAENFGDASAITTRLSHGALSDAIVQAIEYADAFDFLPFEPSLGVSNDDGQVSECEIIVAMPRILNNSDVDSGIIGDAESDLYNIRYRLVSSSQAEKVLDSNQIPIEYLSSPNLVWKSWGVLEPGYYGVDYLRSSDDPAKDDVELKWLTSTSGTRFAKPASLNNMPVNYGYLITPPSGSATNSLELEWEVILEPKSTLTIDGTRITLSMTQSLAIAEDEFGFCNILIESSEH